MPVLVGAAMIAAAILLSTLITAVGSRFIGMDSPNDDNVWLIDRLTGNVYKCQAADRGKASCEADIATGSIAPTRQAMSGHARLSPPGGRASASPPVARQHKIIISLWKRYPG